MLKVMKFGGTSTDTEMHRHCAILKIKQALKEGYKIVVVVSAMGRNNEPYSTNTLMGFTDCLPPDAKDRLLAQGEILSSLVFENQCRKEGLNAHAFSATETGIITDDHYGAAKVLKVSLMWYKHYLNEADVLIVPGFIGISLSGHLTTLGKGGSDKTAILLSNALCAKETLIYTDVDGIYDLDPKENIHAKRYEKLSFDECLKLVEQGASVMMKESVELAKEKNIEFYVASTFKEGIGTKVSGKTISGKV